MMDDNMTIGERITTLRKKKNLSQLQLADQLEVSRQAVSKWENDLSSPDTLNLIKLADILDTEVEYLATGRKAPTPLPPAPKVVVRVEEKVVEVERIVEKESIQLVEKPVIRPTVRVKYRTDPALLALVGVGSLVVGFLLGLML